MARRLAVLALALVLALGGAHSAAETIEPSRNMTDACYSDPTAAVCAGFQRTDADWSSDLDTLCAEMPFMIGCSMHAQCQSGQANGNSPFCTPASLVADVCVADDMSGMKGCEAHNALCSPGSMVQQCTAPGEAPAVPTTFQTKADIDGVCTSHSMDGCQDCTSVGRTNFKSCPELFNIYAKLCVSMPDMAQCQNWKAFCANATLAAAFPMFCTGDAADGSSSALPPMKMWVHQSTRDIFLFKEWVPNSTGQYIGMCIGMCVLAVFTQFLKAVRLRVELRWSAALRKPSLCCTLQGGPPPRPGSEDSGSGGSGMKASESDSELGEVRPCCGGGGVPGPAAAEAAAPPVPTRSRALWWRSRARRWGGVSLCGVQLVSRDALGRNFWRACFTFCVMLLDYALMLVVMTFNLGIIFAVVGGFAIGALLFGHAGERPSGPVVHQVAPASPTSDLEAVFVEGSACCSGGSGCGGGAHSGGQL